MNIKEVARSSWELFFERVSQQSREAMVSIEVVENDGTRKQVAESAPFQGVVLDTKANACSDLVTIKVGPVGEKPLTHEVTEPIHIKLKNGGNSRYHSLHLQAESVTTILTFRPGLSEIITEDLDISG